MWGEREGDPKLILPGSAAFVFKKMLLHPWERKASAWRLTSCPQATPCMWAVPTSPEIEKTQIKNKAQSDPKGPA